MPAPLPQGHPAPRGAGPPGGAQADGGWSPRHGGETARLAELGFKAAQTLIIMIIVFQSLYEETVKPQQLVKDPCHGVHLLFTSYKHAHAHTHTH